MAATAMQRISLYVVADAVTAIQVTGLTNALPKYACLPCTAIIVTTSAVPGIAVKRAAA